jgi:hypothetical protein
MNLIYPTPTRELAIASIGCHDNRHLRDLAESIDGNMGDPSHDDKGSGSTDGETRPKSSKACDGSQRGHSTQRVGKPRTRGRATA